jgi:hypothetical protein
MAINIDNRSDSLDQTVRIFDNFYNFNLVVPSNQYDIVHGYFVETCDTKTIADNFTAFFFKIAQDTGIPATTLLESIQGQTKLDMNRTIAYYLNTFKSKSALYGISFIPQPNLPAARNIIL